MDWIEVKYLNLLSNRLRNFKKKSGEVYNFSCPLCGDSKNSTIKARGYVYAKQGRARFICHNCGASSTLTTFIKDVDDALYREMQVEKIKENLTGQKPPEPVYKPAKPFAFTKRPEVVNEALSKIKKISQLAADHPAKLYVLKRQLPNQAHGRLYYCPKFYRWSNLVVPGSFTDESLQHDHPRLVIPFLDPGKRMFAFQGRAFGKSPVKYLTIKVDAEAPKIYGLDRFDPTRTGYVLEGPLNSLFLSNALAAAGGDLAPAMSTLNKEKLVLVFDNERRKKETVHKMEKAIDQGFAICIWPESVTQKDINDMVLSGLEPEHVQHIIETRTFKGLTAKLELANWKKI